MQIAQQGLQEFLNWKYPDLCAHWRAVNLFFNPFISVSPAFTMKFFTISANCKCSGAFFSHMQTFMAQMAGAASTQRWAAPQGVGGTAWAGISQLCWVRCHNSHFQGMPRELNVLTLVHTGEGREGSDNWLRWDGIWLPQQRLEGTPDGSSQLCSHASGLQCCSQTYLRNTMWIWNWLKCIAAQISAVSGFTLKSHLLQILRLTPCKTKLQF